MLNLDPALLDQDKIRFKKRKKLLLISALPVVALLIFAFFFLKTGIYNIVLSQENNNRLFTTSSLLNNVQSATNFIEPYVVYYNDGYIKLVNASTRSDLTAAEKAFRESLKYNPSDSMLCDIYGNLSYTIELQALDDMKNNDYDTAIANYNRAEGVLIKENCVNRNKKAETAWQRINDERRKAIAAINNLVDEGGDGNSTIKRVSETQLKQIEERQKTIDELGGTILRYGQGAKNNSSTNSFVGDYAPRF